MNILDKTKCPDNFDAIPNPLYASWVYWWLKSRGADVSKVTPKFCYAEFVQTYPDHVQAFLEVVEKTESVQHDLDKLLIKAGALDVLGGVEL
jgi:hypothetical protein